MSVRGLAVGKFWPPHRGHQHLINTALNNCDQLYIYVIQRDFERPTGARRVLWLREWYPQAIIRLTNDDVADTHDAWAKKTVDMLGFTPDIVFTSEEYGDGWAKALGCQHYSVDPGRFTYLISGTKVREYPYAYWDMLHPDVRAYYTKRVVIVGGESCGKTTLARNLAKHFETIWVPEWARIYGEEQNYGPEDWERDKLLFETISIMQPRLENALAAQSNRVLICDTDLLVTSIWHETYRPGESNQAILDAHQMQVDAHPISLYLHALPDVPWVQDGGRNRGSDGTELGSRLWFRDRFREELPDTGVPVVELSGSWTQREETAILAVTQLFAKPEDFKI